MTVRAPVGELAINQYSQVTIGRGVCAISGNYFIYSLLQAMHNHNYWIKFSSVSTFSSINSNDIKNAIIGVPSSEKQKKIGLFFKQIDKLIELQSVKLKHLKQLKKDICKSYFVKISNI